YAKNGKLDKTLKTKSDGTKVLTEYDTNTGKKTAKIKSTPDGKVASRTDYDAKTGSKKSRTVYEYNKEGQKTGIKNYTYNFKGEVATREQYDANRNLVSKSTYLHNDDGSMIRTDRDPKTGEVLGTSEFQYDKSGRQISKTDRDKDGNIKSVSEKEYYPSDIIKSYEKVAYNTDGSYSKKTNNYDKNGNLTSITNAKYDKDGQQISSKTEKVEVKETKINDLPKLDYKALEKEFGGDGKGLVDFAKKFLGYNEANGSYKKFTGGRTEAWCADFVTYIIKNYAASKGIKLPSGFGSSSVAGLMAWGKANGLFQDTTNMSSSEKANYAKKNLKPGDIIIWKSNGASHTGIVKSVNDDGTFTTIEGNSSDQVKSNKKSIYDKSLTGFIPCSSIIA
ncbi:MAG: CHAP domain-containing protein, partial [Candidatus Gastranaerophilaceae bacterium]